MTISSSQFIQYTTIIMATILLLLTLTHHLTWPTLTTKQQLPPENHKTKSTKGSRLDYQLELEDRKKHINKLCNKLHHQTPFTNLPPTILADYLEEIGKYRDARNIRTSLKELAELQTTIDTW